MTCPHWQGKCRHIGEALPYTGTISLMHHHKTRQLGWQHASCHLQSFNDTFSIGRREEVLLDWNFVQSLQEYQIYKRLLLFDLAACTIWKEVDSVNRGCFAFRLPNILARKQLTASFSCPISSLTMTKGFSGAIINLCTHGEQSNLWLVPVTLQCSFQWSRPEPQLCDQSLFLFLSSNHSACLRWNE